MSNEEYMLQVDALTAQAMQAYDAAAKAKRMAKQAQTEEQRQAYLAEAERQIARYHALQNKAWQVMKPQVRG